MQLDAVRREHTSWELSRVRNQRQDEVCKGGGQLFRAQSTQKAAASPSGEDKATARKWDPSEDGGKQEVPASPASLWGWHKVIDGEHVRCIKKRKEKEEPANLPTSN